MGIPDNGGTVNLGLVIALAAAGGNLSMATLHGAIARAPGWRIARLFAGIALTAGLYSLLNCVYVIDGWPDAVYLAAGRLSFLVGTLHGLLWLVYGYSDGNGSLRAAPRWVGWVALSAVGVGLAFATTGWLVKAPISVVRVTWAGLSYHYPLTTAAGDIYGFLMLGLPAAGILRLAGRFRRGEQFLGWHLGLFGVVFLCAIEEVLVAERILNFPSLLDFGLVILVVPLTWQIVRRVINVSRRLHDLSEHLETEVMRRTSERDEVRDALVEAERNISDLVASLDAIVWEADATTLEVTFVSEGAQRLLGDSAEQWRYPPGFWDQHVHPDDRERVLAATREASQSKKNISLEHRMLTAEGRTIWVRDYVHPIVGSSAAGPNRLRGIIVDVTESRHALEAILESESRFRSLYENATLGIYRTTPDGRILLANPALLRMLGYGSFHELAQRSLNEEGFEPGYPRASFCALLESKDVVTGIEVAWTRRDGSEVFVRESARAVRAADGNVMYYDGIVEDCTERKQAQEALRESEERFRNIADTCPAIIWYGGPDRLITFLNKQAVAFTGREMGELLGSGWVEHVHPDDLARLDMSLASALSSHSSFQTEFRLRRHDGEYRWVLDTAVPRFVGGVYAGHTGIVFDTTDLKRSHEQILATQKLESLGVLSGGIAHYFNNLLGSILAQSELVLSEVPAGSEAAEGVKNIKAGAVRAAEIVRQLLAYAGQESASFEPVHLSRLVGEMLHLLGVSISEDAVLKTDLASNLPVVLANAPLMRQLVMNLITNASEALAPDGGVITVTARVDRDSGSVPQSRMDLQDRDYVRLEVSDNGCGMSEEIQARIFDPFFTTKFAGRGLGLAAAQGIVLRHGGTIEVVSAPGQGTRVEVLLPCASEWAGGDHGVAVPNGTDAGQATSGAVLFVEDEETLRMPISKMLRRKGFSVLEASDGLAAVDLFRANKSRIGVVLLDLTLPGMDGKDVFAEVRRIRPDIKVILTTAYREEMAVNAAGGQHGWAFIRKPYGIFALAELLRDALSARGDRDDRPDAPGEARTGCGDL
jgi:PAS domain S-box-containing protein